MVNHVFIIGCLAPVRREVEYLGDNPNNDYSWYTLVTVVDIYDTEVSHDSLKFGCAPPPLDSAPGDMVTISRPRFSSSRKRIYEIGF